MTLNDSAEVAKTKRSRQWYAFQWRQIATWHNMMGSEAQYGMVTMGNIGHGMMAWRNGYGGGIFLILT
jgi:hypothetical protein